MSAAEKPTDTEPTTMVERWLQEQQQWQRTLFAYVDSMVKNEDFLMHLGNAMRGSLLAGKPYPAAAPDQTAERSPHDERYEQLLFELHKLEGQFQDVLMALEEIRASLRGNQAQPASDAPRTARVRRVPAAGTTPRRRDKGRKRP